MSLLFRSFGEVAGHLCHSDHPSRVMSVFKTGCTFTVSLFPISAYSVSPLLASRDLGLLCIALKVGLTVPRLPESEGDWE